MRFETLPGTDPPGQVSVAASAPSHRPDALRGSDIIVLEEKCHGFLCNLRHAARV